MDMDREDIIRYQTQEGIKRLSVEIIVRVYNDILTKDWYVYYLSQNSIKGDKFTKNKLKKHYTAIEWFMSNRKTNVFFMFLNLEDISDDQMWQAIQNKMDGNKKFCKILEEL